MFKKLFTKKNNNEGTDNVVIVKNSNERSGSVSIGAPKITGAVAPVQSQQVEDPLLSEREVLALFTSFLDRVNLTGEAREKMLNKSLEEKRKMLLLNKVQADKQSTNDKMPEFFMFENLMNLEIMRALDISIRTKDNRWIQKFIELGGVVKLLRTIQTALSKSDEEIVFLGLKCVVRIANSKSMLDSVLAVEKILDELILCIDINRSDIITECLLLFTICARHSVVSFNCVIHALDSYKQSKGLSNSYGWLVPRLLQTESNSRSKYLLLTLINIVMNEPEEIEVRLRVVQDFIDCGLENTINVLKQQVYNFAEEKDFVNQINICTDEIKEFYQERELHLSTNPKFLISHVLHIIETDFPEVVESFCSVLQLLQSKLASNQSIIESLLTIKSILSGESPVGNNSMNLDLLQKCLSEWSEEIKSDKTEFALNPKILSDSLEFQILTAIKSMLKTMEQNSRNRIATLRSKLISYDSLLKEKTDSLNILKQKYSDLEKNASHLQANISIATPPVAIPAVGIPLPPPIVPAVQPISSATAKTLYTISSSGIIPSMPQTSPVQNPTVASIPAPPILNTAIPTPLPLNSTANIAIPLPPISAVPIPNASVPLPPPLLVGTTVPSPPPLLGASVTLPSLVSNPLLNSSTSLHPASTSIPAPPQLIGTAVPPPPPLLAGISVPAPPPPIITGVPLPPPLLGTPPLLAGISVPAPPIITGVPLPPPLPIPASTLPSSSNIPLPPTNPSTLGVPSPMSIGVPPAPNFMPPMPLLGAPLMPTVQKPNLPELPNRAPSVPMKQVQILKVDNKKLQETIWMKEKIIENLGRVEFDEEKIQDLFQQKKATTVTTPASSEDKPKEKVSLLDGKRQQNLSIFLTYIKMKPDELRQAILELDERKFTAESIKKLLANLPSPEEVELYKQSDEDDSNMHNADLFIRSMMLIPRVTERVQVWLFKLSFELTMEDASHPIAKFKKAIEELRNSKKWKKLLELILAITNYINVKSAKGVSYGFKLSSLSKLKDTKTNDNKSNLLAFIVSVVDEKYVELLEFKDEISTVESAGKLAFEAITEDITKLEKGMKLVERELESFRTTYQAEGDKFLDVIEDFKLMHGVRTSQVTDDYALLKTELESLAVYYGEDPASLMKQPNEFFKNIGDFAKDFYQERSKLENAKKEEIKKKKADAKSASTAQLKATPKVDIPNIDDIAVDFASLANESSFAAKRASRRKQSMFFIPAMLPKTN